MSYLVNKDDVHSLFEFDDAVITEVAIDRVECLTGSTPSRVHIHHQQLLVVLVEVLQEVLLVSDGLEGFSSFGRHEVSKNIIHLTTIQTNGRLLGEYNGVLYWL